MYNSRTEDVLRRMSLVWNAVKLMKVHVPMPIPKLRLARASGKSDGALTWVSLHARFPSPRCMHSLRARAWSRSSGVSGCGALGRMSVRSCDPVRIRSRRSRPSPWMATSTCGDTTGVIWHGPRRSRTRRWQPSHADRVSLDERALS